MTSHWPTFADGKFWCACTNMTFPTEDAWLIHATYSVMLYIMRDKVAEVAAEAQPSESSSGHAAPSR